jgi:tetratricopeptide (TPR) repeat protein
VIHGLGGSGKTSLALETAFRAGKHGAEAWWVSAADPAVLVAGMRAVGRRLGIDQQDLEYGDAADLIWQRLEMRPQPWLLVIDGADDPQALRGAGNRVADGRGWLRPSTGQAGTVLVTSRDGTEDWGLWCHRHRLGMLTAADAAAVLADHAGRHPSLGNEDDAQMLALRLGRLPLALKIAGAYLASSAALPAAFTDTATITTYRGYRDAMNVGRPELKSDSSFSRMTYAEVLTLIGQIWELTLDRLSDRQMPEARRILQLLASFADSPVPYEFLLNPEVLAADHIFRGITGPRLWEVITALDSFGLLEISQPTQGISSIGVVHLHPLIRDTSRSQMDADDRVKLLELASSLLGKATVQFHPRHPETWPVLQLLVPHATEVFYELADMTSCHHSALESAANAAFVTAMYQSGQGSKAHAETLYRAVLEAQTRILGPDDLDTLDTRHQLAHEIGARGDHATAEAEHRAVLEAETRILGADHPNTLVTRHCLAHEIAERGDHATAEAEHRAVLEAQIQMLGPEAPRTLSTRRCLAIEIGLQGDHADAEAELRAVLEAQMRILEPDDLSIVNTRFELAWEISRQGNYATAQVEYEAVLEAETRILGPDHPDTLQTRFDLAMQMSNQGDNEGAVAEYRAILEVQTRILGPDHPQTLKTRHNLATEFRVLRDHAAALSELQAVLEAETRILGTENPHTLLTRHQLAHEIALEDHAAALAEFQAVLEAQRRILGPENPDTLETLRCLDSEIAHEKSSE